MRGKVPGMQKNRIAKRITPAYAGKSFSVRLMGIQLQDHPRLCGEKFRPRHFLHLLSGSPPPMRGKATFHVSRNTTPRITPAYAGKRNSVPEWGLVSTGSPPPMRGKVGSFYVKLLDTGITPAYAGKSFTTQLKSTKDEDHPRLCGEKCRSSSQLQRLVGSPPPMRGKGTPAGAASPPAGITPAYAGKRVSSLVYTMPFWDHPRLCGEKI